LFEKFGFRACVELEGVVRGGGEVLVECAAGITGCTEDCVGGHCLLSCKTSWMFGLGYANAVSLFIRVFYFVWGNISYDSEVPRCLCNVGDDCWPKNRLVVLRILRLPTAIENG